MEIYHKVLSEDEYRQVRLCVSEYKDVEYLSLREYYQSFEGEWMPGKKGITIPLTIDLAMNLFTGVSEVLSLAESRQVIEDLFGDIIRDTYTK